MLYNQNWDNEIKVNPIAEVLLDAANLLEKHGHTKFMRRDGESMCLLGAIEIALCKRVGCYDYVAEVEAATAIANTLGINNGYSNPEAVANWNNEKERTAQDVIDVMRETARNLMK